MFSLFILLILRFPTATDNHAAFANAFMQHVNAVRAKGCTCEGVRMPAIGSVKWHSKLEISATLHARQMLRYQFFEHFSKGGKDIGERATAVGYPWRTIGENLGRGQLSIPELIDDWIESPTHCRLLMNPKFREMGAAHAGNYWVLHMGVRKEGLE